ncbi:hypothetical protein PYW08_005137 [Mythimna loreyi]|uniref:Uncharacterized protein n=1 Tax=Mythimna loreyi TaxID=667449 RepID=A0ACC2QEM1_9NEOP|nr:hypothetical protein PYW08_005137 [Mythimna loreyi]
MSFGNLLSDATKTKKEEPPTKHYVDIMFKMSASFANIFKLIKKLKERNATNPKTSSDKPLQAAEEARETQEDDQKYTEELDRSDDNVLTTKTSNFAEKYEQVEDEWIPIGSGKTYVHKDCFKKERWRSYRLATRALLIGAFPRSVLLTSSMTGKKPPAFKNRPAKMCLDPKKLSDIVIEVTKHYDVSESAEHTSVKPKIKETFKTPTEVQKLITKNLYITNIMSFGNLLSDANKTKKEEPPTKHYVDIMSTMSASFANIFKLITKLKERNATNLKTSSDKPLQAAEEAHETQEDDQKNTEELDRSDDNVLTTKTSNFAEKYEQVEDEWKCITNKCSDETKWSKTPKKPQKKKLKKKQKKCKNDENEPPTSSVNEE